MHVVPPPPPPRWCRTSSVDGHAEGRIDSLVDLIVDARQMASPYVWSDQDTRSQLPSFSTMWHWLLGQRVDRIRSYSVIMTRSSRGNDSSPFASMMGPRTAVLYSGPQPLVPLFSHPV